MENHTDYSARQAEVSKILNIGIAISVVWPLGLILWPLAFMPLIAVYYAAKARKSIRQLNGGIKGMWKVWWCFCAGGLELALTLTFVVMLILGFLQGNINYFAPSPDGRSIAAIRDAELRMPAADNPPVLLHRVYLRIQGIPLPAGQGTQEVRINNEDGEYYSVHGGLVWSPDSRRVAFTTEKNDTRRLWVVGMAAKPNKSLISGDIHSFRWEDGSHLVFATEDGEIFRTTVSADGAAGELKLLFSAGKLAGAYQYAYHLYGSRYEFDNPLSPQADQFLYGDRGSLTAVNISSAVKRSFPVLGLPVRFWWDKTGKSCVVESMEGTDTGFSNPPNHYYLYQTEKAALTLLASHSKSEAVASGQGRLWFADGRYFVLSSGYPAYMTWLVDTASMSAAWMENEVKKLKDEAPSRLTMLPLPLEHLEHNQYTEALPEPDVNAEDFLEVSARRSKTIHARAADGLDISLSPGGNSFLICPHNTSDKDAKGRAVCRVMKLESGPAGSASISILKSIDLPDMENLVWQADGKGFLSLKGQKFTFVSAF